jgi:hypothetical protein
MSSKIPFIIKMTAVGITAIPFILPFLRTKPPLRALSWRAELEKKSVPEGFESVLIPGPDGKLEFVTNASSMKESSLTAQFLYNSEIVPRRVKGHSLLTCQESAYSLLKAMVSPSSISSKKVLPVLKRSEMFPALFRSSLVTQIARAVPKKSHFWRICELVEDMLKKKILKKPSGQERMVYTVEKSKNTSRRSAVIDGQLVGMESWAAGKFSEFMKGTTYDPAVGYPIDNSQERDTRLDTNTVFDNADNNPLVIDSQEDLRGDEHAGGIGSLGGGGEYYTGETNV